MDEPCLPEVDKLKLVRDGTVQGDRFPAPLDPETVPVHGRGQAHAMLFAREYAKYLKYVPSPIDEPRNWQGFFGKDMSVALASAAVQDVDRYRRVILASFEALEDLGNAGSPEVVRHHIGFIFGAVGTLARQLDVLKETLPTDIALKATIVNLIKTRLREALKRLVSYFRGDQERLPADLLIEPQLIEPEPQDAYQLSILGVAPRSFHQMLAGKLSKDWLGGGTWDDFKDTGADASVFGDPGGTVFERANACAGHNLFSGACDQFLKAYARVVSDARVNLQATLARYDKHDPHYALFLAFLRMFEYARADINALGGRHLDFYYRKVLQLAEQPAEPAEAHVVVELAKNADSHALAAGTEFRAGRDAKKKPVVFMSDRALVANKATVSSVRNVYRDPKSGAIYVKAEARAEGAWHPFESKGEIGSFGFAIASHCLYLAEGARTVTLTAHVVDEYAGATGQSMKEAFICRFTTADGWLEVSPSKCEFKDAFTFEITIGLDGDQPGIGAFDAKVHASNYGVALPILEVRLKAVAGMLSTFGVLLLHVQSIDLAVDVQGFRSLALSTDRGPVDASKPFQPFGPAPVVGSSLVIGCQEAFSKAELDKFELSLTWRNWTSHTTKAVIQGLAGGQWTVLEPEVTVLNAASETVGLTSHLVEYESADSLSVPHVVHFDVNATSGYVKLSLKGTFGHETYAARLAQYVIDVVKSDGSSETRVSEKSMQVEEPPYVLGKGTQEGMPPEPYTPELESITLAYSVSQKSECSATEEKVFNGRKARFYHLTSFGLSEQHGYLRTESEDTGVSLMPPLRHGDALEGTRVLHEGELYIGLDGVVAPQHVALLFQVEDGSADPLVGKPSPHLHFSYLRDGDWVAFDSDQVEDRTSELLASGIITFSIPADASTRDTLLPGGLTWIRIAVGEHTRAVCRLLAVRAQAVQVTFTDRENDLAFLATPLAAGTITKLVTPAAAIKSVTQPFESFGSRTKETARAFHTRVSERLRHKDRAIALWDIERLVLGAFPGIHRVKCLNHTRYEPSDSGGIYQELAAGHVTVVTLPSVSKGYAADPLTPYTSLGVLKEVKAYLAERMACFATLHVRNPLYERVRVACNARLRGGSDETWCLNQLKHAITQFLAPWAFDAAQRPSFGGRVYRSALINLVEEQDYVDYVTDFRLQRVFDDGTESEQLEVVEGALAVSVLTSVSEEEHSILVIDEKEAAGVGERCGCSP